MKFVLFYHSLISDWNHGNAHFLRGIAAELLGLGHQVDVYEPANGWSLENLRRERGTAAIDGFMAAFPKLRSRFYQPRRLDLDRVLSAADVVIVHEWTDPGLAKAIGRHRCRQRHYRLLFHDTHHRAVTEPEAVARLGLDRYDGVLAFGRVLRDIYLDRGWCERAWVWHEAADTRVFRPATTAPAAGQPGSGADGDLVWIGNWGDEERTRELEGFLVDPVRRLQIRAAAYGVRYPEPAREALAAAGVEYGGWVPNYAVPGVFARYRATVHIPRRPYAEALPGIPTIRPFEALACGIPLVSAPWDDVEGLFTAGRDYLTARTGPEMEAALKAVLNEPDLAQDLSEHGRRTVLDRHTCAHRVAELLIICAELGVGSHLLRGTKTRGYGVASRAAP